MWCNDPFNRVPKHFHQPRRKPCTLRQSPCTYFPPFPASGNPQSASYLCVFISSGYLLDTDPVFKQQSPDAFCSVCIFDTYTS